MKDYWEVNAEPVGHEIREGDLVSAYLGLQGRGCIRGERKLYKTSDIQHRLLILEYSQLK